MKVNVHVLDKLAYQVPYVNVPSIRGLAAPLRAQGRMLRLKVDRQAATNLG